MKKLEFSQMETIEGGSVSAKCAASTLANELGWGIALGLVLPGVGWFVGAGLGAIIGATAAC